MGRSNRPPQSRKERQAEKRAFVDAMTGQTDADRETYTPDWARPHEPHEDFNLAELRPGDAWTMRGKRYVFVGIGKRVSATGWCPVLKLLVDDKPVSMLPWGKEWGEFSRNLSDLGSLYASGSINEHGRIDPKTGKLTPPNDAGAIGRLVREQWGVEPPPSPWRWESRRAA